MVSKSLKILIGVTVGVIVLAGIAVALYFTVFEGSVSKLEDAFTPSSPSSPETPSPTYYTNQSLIISKTEIELDDTNDLSQDQCQQHCTDTSGCVAYRWTDQSSDTTVSNKCYLFDAVTSLKTNAGTNSYVGFSCDVFECDTSFVTVSNFNTKTALNIKFVTSGDNAFKVDTDQECREKCSENDTCRFSAYLSETDVNGFNCQLAKGFSDTWNVSNDSSETTSTLGFLNGARILTAN